MASTDVCETAITIALNRHPTLRNTLIYLGRRNDIRPTTYTEREGGYEHRTHVVGEPVAFALNWVHGRCSWKSVRNGAELWDYVAQSARGEIIDAEVREVVVPELRAVDTPEMRRAFWSELLSRFPHFAVELSGDAPAMLTRNLGLGFTRLDNGHLALREWFDDPVAPPTPTPPVIDDFPDKEPTATTIAKLPDSPPPPR